MASVRDGMSSDEKWCNRCAAMTDHATNQHPDGDKFDAIRQAVNDHWFHGSRCIGCGYNARMDRNLASAHITASITAALASFGDPLAAICRLTVDRTGHLTAPQLRARYSAVRDIALEHKERP